MISEKFNLDLPFPDVFPKTWEAIGPRDAVLFRNLDHFKYVVSHLTQRKDDNCNVSYKDALADLLQGKSNFPEKEQASIRNLVRSNLHKRGLITQEVYEAYKYDVQGVTVGVDVGKYAAGEPDCVITPTRQYIDFFYELYISISYPYYVDDKDVRKNMAKLLATIEELERQHIFIKITLILPIHYAGRIGDNKTRNFFSSIPLFSHKEPKSVGTMAAVLNERLLRKFYFAILEDLYGKGLSTGYGQAMELSTAMNPGNTFDEIEFFNQVRSSVGIE